MNCKASNGKNGNKKRSVSKSTSNSRHESDLRDYESNEEYINRIVREDKERRFWENDRRMG